MMHPISTVKKIVLGAFLGFVFSVDVVSAEQLLYNHASTTPVAYNSSGSYFILDSSGTPTVMEIPMLGNFSGLYGKFVWFEPDGWTVLASTTLVLLGNFAIPTVVEMPFESSPPMTAGLAYHGTIYIGEYTGFTPYFADNVLVADIFASVSFGSGAVVNISAPVPDFMIATSSLGIVDVVAGVEGLSEQQSFSTSSLFVVSDGGACLPQSYPVSSGLSAFEGVYECPVSACGSIITATWVEIPYAPVSTSTTIYNAQCQAIFGYTATSTDEDYAVEGCNLATSTPSYLDLGGAMKRALCWAFVPRNVTVNRLKALSWRNSLLGYFPLLLDSFSALWTSTEVLPDVVVTMGGQTSTWIDWSVIREDSRWTEIEDIFRSPLSAILILLCVIMVLQDISAVMGMRLSTFLPHYKIEPRVDPKHIFPLGKK